jgi:hypothetical protein
VPPPGGRSRRGEINASTSGSALPSSRKGAAVPGATDAPRIGRSAGNYLVSSVTRRSTSSSTVPVLGRSRLPASSASSFLVRLW